VLSGAIAKCCAERTAAVGGSVSNLFAQLFGNMKSFERWGALSFKNSLCRMRERRAHIVASEQPFGEAVHFPFSPMTEATCFVK
jgi:hypothetical protein